MILAIEKAIVTAIKGDISTFDDGYIFDPDRDLNNLTRPFFVVRVMTMTSEGRTFIDAGAAAGTDQLKQEDYLVWVYVYTRNDITEMRDLPESVKVTLYKDITVGSDTYRIEGLFLDYIGASDQANEMEKYLSVVTGTLQHFRQIAT